MPTAGPPNAATYRRDSPIASSHNENNPDPTVRRPGFTLRSPALLFIAPLLRRTLFVVTTLIGDLLRAPVTSSSGSPFDYFLPDV